MTNEQILQRIFGVTKYDKGYKAGRRTATLDVVFCIFGCNVEDAVPNCEWQVGFVNGWQDRLEKKG